MSVTSSLKTYYINFAQDKKFPIVFGEGAVSSIEKDYGDATKALLVTNSVVREKCSGLIDQIIEHLPIDVFTHVIDDGEQFKHLDTVSGIVDACIQHGLGRKDLIVSVGGGVTGDMVGFAASVYLRGVNVIQVPTSLLAQVDAAIGGKTGVNHSKGKNLIGTFYQPIKTIIDPSVLSSLSSQGMKEGLAEIIKYGVIKDKPLFWYIEQHSNAIMNFNYNDCSDTWNFMIEKSIQNKAHVVSQDEKESEYREILNFGHTIGHAIEAIYGYQTFTHGEAVAIGMVVESIIANECKLLSAQNLERIHKLILQFNYNFDLGNIDRDQFFSVMRLDKKVRKDVVRFVLPTDIGQTKTVESVTNSQVVDSMNRLLDREII